MIDILLATYNGEEYIGQQLDSLLNQTYKDIRILIHDDCSKDQTVSVVKEYVKKYPNQITLLEDQVHCGSAQKNFMHIAKSSTADYVMFCDQDDFWLPEKVEKTLNEMKRIEAQSGKNIPILVFCDYKAVDGNLQDLDFNEAHNQIAKYKLNFSNLLVQNYVTGCTMMINRVLCQMMGDYDSRILMHDWWLALLASSCGRISHFSEPLILYRQHGDNTVGAVDVKSFKYRWSKFTDKRTKNMQYLYLNQAKAMYERYGDTMPKESLSILSNFIHLYECPHKVQRIYRLIHGHYLKSDTVRIIAQLLYV